MDRGARLATVYRVTNSWTGLKWLSTYMQGISLKKIGTRWGLEKKESACDAGDTGDTGSNLALQRSPGVGNGNPSIFT